MVPILGALRFAPVMSLSALCWFIFSKKINKSEIYRLKPVRFILTIFFAATFSIPFSYYKLGSFEAWQTLVSSLSIYLVIVASIRSRSSLLTLLWLLILCMDYHAFWITRDYFTGNYMGLRVRGHVGGVFRGANELAEFIIMTIPICWIIFRNSKKKISIIFSLGSIGLLLAGLISTQSRGGLLGLSSMCIMCIVVSKKKLSALLAVISLALCFIFFLPSDILQRYSTLTVYRENIDPSARSRLFIWKKGLQMFVDHPFTGVGIGQFGVAFGTEYRDRDQEWEEIFAPYFGYNAWLRPHNTFVQVLAEIGIIGILGLVFFLITTCRYLWHISRSENETQNLVAKCILTSVVGYFTCLMFDQQAFSIPTFTLFSLMTLPWLLFKSTAIVKGETNQSPETLRAE